MFKVWIEKTLLMTDHGFWGQSGRVWGIELSALCGVAAWWWGSLDWIPGDPSLQTLAVVKGVMGWVLLVSKAENIHVLGGRLVWWKGVLPGCLGAWSPPRCNYVQWILKRKQKCVKVFIVVVSGWRDYGQFFFSFPYFPSWISSKDLTLNSVLKFYHLLLVI